MNRMSVKTIGAAATVLLLACSAIATGAPDSNNATNTLAIRDAPLKVGEPFIRARSRLIKSGWKPIRMHRNDGYEYSGTEKNLAERNILEVDGCSIDAGVLCIFYYSRLTKCLRVDTVGEQVAHITVTKWTDECPEKNP
jgi:hypothetical protein